MHVSWEVHGAFLPCSVTAGVRGGLWGQKSLFQFTQSMHDGCYALMVDNHEGLMLSAGLLLCGEYSISLLMLSGVYTLLFYSRGLYSWLNLLLLHLLLQQFGRVFF